MDSWEIIDHQALPDDEGAIYLRVRGDDYDIQVNGRQLMGNQLHGSEDALADLACDRLASLDDARVLVGGLGMGFTLAAALRRVGPQGCVTVAEFMKAVVKWNREFVGAAAGHPLRDERAEVHIGDVAELVEDPPAPWSAILLDVDNGPDYLTCPANGDLYTTEGLNAAHAALIPGGVLGIWSAGNSEALTARLRKANFEVEVLHFTEDGRPTHDNSGTHVLWMATRAQVKVEKVA